MHLQEAAVQAGECAVHNFRREIADDAEDELVAKGVDEAGFAHNGVEGLGSAGEEDYVGFLDGEDIARTVRACPWYG